MGSAVTPSSGSTAIWPRRRAASGCVRTRARRAWRCAATNLIAAVRAAEAGFGIAMVPCLTTRDAAVERLSAGVPLAVDAWLVMHRQVQKTARVRAVADFLVGVFAEHGATLAGG